MTIRILVADDQPVVRSGLRAILSTQPDLEVVGEAADGDEAIAAVHRLDPDVVLLDIRMPGTDGLSAARSLVASGPRPRIVVMTTFDLDEYVHEALRIGVSGFVLKDAPRHQVIEAVRVAAAGDALIDPRVTRRLISRFAVPASAPHREADRGPGGLTDREREVLVLIGRGRTNAEIAEELFLGESTVKTHINRIFAKLHLRDRAQAVIVAYESGLVGDDGLSRRPRP